jgi:hypothetical protein
MLVTARFPERTHQLMTEESDSNEQVIEAPNQEDLEDLARRLVHARELVEQVTRMKLDGSEADLDAIQAVLESNTIEPEASYSLEALGVAFGCMFIDNRAGFDWWIAVDESGRAPAVRYKKSSLLIFAQDMIVKRIENGESVDMHELYEGLCAGIEELLEENPHLEGH